MQAGQFTDALLETAERMRTPGAVLTALAAGMALAAFVLPVAPVAAGLAVSGAGIAGALWSAGLLHNAARVERARRLRMLRVLTEADAAATLLSDEDGEIRFMNSAARADLGDRVGEAVVLGLAAILPDQTQALIRLQAIAHDNQIAAQELSGIDGPVRVSLRVLPRLGMLWRIERLAAAGHERQDGAPAIALPMLRVNASGLIVAMNDAARRLLGRRERSLDRVFARLPIEDHPVQTLATPSGTVTVRVVGLPGPRGEREVYLIPSADPQVSDDAVRLLFEALPVGLVRMTPEGEILHANRRARALLAHDLEGPVNFSRLVDGLGRPVADWLADAARGRGLSRGEVVRASLVDGERYLQVVLDRVREGGRLELIAVLQDATEMKTLQAQVTQSQKMQAIGQLAGGIAHDFNNLLTAISGHCDLLLLRHDEGDPDYADLVQIQQNANRAAALVGQLLAFSRKQTMRAEIVELPELLSDLAHLLNRLIGEKLELVVDHAPDLSPVRADPRHLEQVFVNLVVNARDAMPEGGRISVETRNLHLEKDMPRGRVTVPAGNWVQIRVADQGHGIPPDKIDKIFEPFFTTKRTGEGTGLGLSTVYGIIKQSGGYIFVDSSPGNGTVFTVCLPAAVREANRPANDAVAPQKPAVGAAGTPGAVILLVEDEAPVRAFAARALRMQGHVVHEAESAEAALELLSDPALTVDLIISDMVMPGMDGPSWVAEARRAHPEARVIFVSGYAEDHLAEARDAIPNAVFLPKPFSLSELTSRVSEMLAA